MTLDLEVVIKKGLSKFSTFFSHPFVTAIVIVAIVLLISSSTQNPIKVIFWSTLGASAAILMHDHANLPKLDESKSFAFTTTGTKVGALEYVKLGNKDEEDGEDGDKQDKENDEGGEGPVSHILGKGEKNKIKIPQLKGFTSHPFIS